MLAREIREKKAITISSTTAAEESGMTNSYMADRSCEIETGNDRAAEEMRVEIQAEMSEVQEDDLVRDWTTPKTTLVKEKENNNAKLQISFPVGVFE